MAQNPKLKIEIEAVDKVTATLEEASKALRSLSTTFKETAKAAKEAESKERSFFGTLKSKTKEAGKAVDGLADRFKHLEGAIFNLKTAVAAALGGLTIGKIVKDGIEFNAQLQTAKLGLSALITSSYELRDAQGQVLSGMQAFTAAQEEAERLYREILNRAMQTASTSRELLETFQAILPYAAQTGMSLEQTLNMSEAFVNAAKALGLGLGQAAQEARALFMGDIDQNTQLLRALNISKQMVDTWKEQGRLYDEVMRKLQPFVAASREFADTWEGVTSSISDLISMLEGSVFKDTFHALNEGLKKARDYLQNLLKDENKLNEISEKVANGFINAAEAIVVTTDEIYRFGKSIYDFVNSHKELTEFGVLGYLLLGKKGALLGTVIGGIAEVAEKSKNVFPTTKQILNAQPNTVAVLSTGKVKLPDSEVFKKFQEYREKHGGQLPTKPVELPFKEKESTPKDELIKFLESLRPHRTSESETPEKRKITLKPKPAPSQTTEETQPTLSPLEVSLNLTTSENYSLLTPPAPLTERLYEKLQKKQFSTFSLGESKAFENYLLQQPDYGLEAALLKIQHEREKEKFTEKFKEQYLEFAKEYRPAEWKKQKLADLQKWYEEQKRILGESEELQELYEHKKLEIEKEAHEQEKKLYIEKLRQISSWKAGVFKSLDDLHKKWSDTNQLIYDGTTQTFQALENSLETLFFDAMRGKLKSLGDYVNSFLASVESAIAGIAAQGVASSIVNFGKSILGFTAAEGGIIQEHFIPLKAFATGGVVDRPTLGLVGEGKYPEAIVPLPDGRSIPVKFEGKGNGQVNIEIVLVDDRSKIPPPQIGKQQVVLWVAEDINNNGILRKVIQQKT